MTQQKAGQIIMRVIPGWMWHSNYGASDTGRIWLLRNPGLLQHTIVNIDNQFIYCSINNHSRDYLNDFTATYGLHTIYVAGLFNNVFGNGSDSLKLVYFW